MPSSSRAADLELAMTSELSLKGSKQKEYFANLHTHKNHRGNVVLDKKEVRGRKIFTEIIQQ